MWRLLSVPFALLLAFALPACDEELPPGTFPCGVHGGACQIGSEVCIEAEGGCSTCRALEAPCAADDGCGCLDDVDLQSGPLSCDGPPMCAPSGEGLTVTCFVDSWGCG